MCIFMFAMDFKSLVCEMFKNHKNTISLQEKLGHGFSFWYKYLLHEFTCCFTYHSMSLVVALNTIARAFSWL